MVSCPGCGAGMRFDPISQMVKCDHCSTKLAPEDASEIQYAGETPIFDSIMYTCPQCGAELVSDDDTAATFCSFCGSSVMLIGKAVKMVAPTSVIPFKLAKERCTKQYQDVIKKALFAPNYMRSEEQVSKFRGIYMPYWNYDFHKEGITNILTKSSYRSGDYIITDHYAVNADIKADYRGFAADASSSFADELSEAIAPFNVREAKAFSPSYISGFYADTADVQPDIYANQARAIVAADIREEILRRPECKGSEIENDSQLKAGVQVDNAHVSYFPVWFMANRHKDHVSYAVINGQTGKVAADIPVDYKKYLLGSLIIALPIMLLLNFLLTLTPAIILVVAVAFAAVCHILTSEQLDFLYTREHYLNDKGLQSIEESNDAGEQAGTQSQNQKKKKPKKAKQSKFMLTIVISVILIVLSALQSFGLTPGDMLVTLFALLWGGLFVFVFGFAFFQVIRALLGMNKKDLKVARDNTIFQMPAGQKMKVLWKPLLAEIAGGILYVVSPVQDIVYYTCIIGIMILILFCFWDLVRLHNKLTMRMPRQFGKRGGDEHEGI